MRHTREPELYRGDRQGTAAEHHPDEADDLATLGVTWEGLVRARCVEAGSRSDFGQLGKQLPGFAPRAQGIIVDEGEPKSGGPVVVGRAHLLPLGLCAVVDAER